MWTVTFTVSDSKNAKSTFSLNFPLANTISQIENFVTSLATPLSWLINGAIEAISIARSMTLPVIFDPTPDPVSDVEEGARIQMRSQSNNITGFRIPALDETYVQPNSRALDLSNAQVQALISLLEDGLNLGGGVFIKPSDNRGSVVKAVTDAYESFTSSRGKR